MAITSEMVKKLREASGLGMMDCKNALVESNGDVLWIKNLGTSIRVGSGIFSAIQTSDSCYLSAGTFWGNLYLAKVAPFATGLKFSDYAITQDFSLFQNYPNPFNPSTNIEFRIPNSEFVTLKIYDLLGQEVVTLLSASLLATPTPSRCPSTYSSRPHPSGTPRGRGRRS